MSKMIRAVMIITLIMFVMIAQTCAGFAASSVIYVTADKTEAEPGEPVNFTVSLGPVSDMGTMQMVLDIPEGLTYVKGSGKLADGLKSKLGFDQADFTEVSLMINGMASAADYSSGSDTVLGTFSCTVDSGFKGKAEVGLANLEFYSCKTWEDHTGDYSVSKATVTVGKDSGQDSAADPDKSSDQGKASGNSGSIGSNGSQDQQGSASSEDQAGNGSSAESGSAQPAGSEDQASDDANAASDEAAPAEAPDSAEAEQSSAAVWPIAVIAVLLIAAVIAVFLKRRKRQ